MSRVDPHCNFSSYMSATKKRMQRWQNTDDVYWGVYERSMKGPDCEKNSDDCGKSWANRRWVPPTKNRKIITQVTKGYSCEMSWIFNWGKKLISLFLSGKWSQWGDIRIRSLQTYSNYFWMIGDVSSYAQHLVDQPDLFEIEISITISIDNLVGQDRWGLWGLWSIFVMHGITQKHPPLHPSLHFSGGQITSKEALPKALQKHPPSCPLSTFAIIFC